MLRGRPRIISRSMGQGQEKNGIGKKRQQLSTKNERTEVKRRGKKTSPFICIIHLML